MGGNRAHSAGHMCFSLGGTPKHRLWFPARRVLVAEMGRTTTGRPGVGEESSHTAEEV